MSISERNTRQNTYLEVRSAFIASGKSLHAWCATNGVAMPNARAALLGEWSGPKAQALVKRIVEASKAARKC